MTLGGSDQADRLGDPLRRLQPDRHDHLLPVRAGVTPNGTYSNNVYTDDGDGQRQRHLHHSHGQQPRRLRCPRRPAPTSGWPSTAATPATTAVAERPRRRARDGHDSSQPGRRRASSRPSASGTTRTARPDHQLNGGGTTGSATHLGNWLATNFPNLFGASADPSNPYGTSLAGQTNAQVASVYMNLLNPSGTNKTYVQIFAVALGIYATNSALAGGNYAQSFGFTMLPGRERAPDLQRRVKRRRRSACPTTPASRFRPAR